MQVKKGLCTVEEKIFWFGVAALVCIVVPFVAVALLGLKKRLRMDAFLIGAAGFFLCQIVLRIPLLSLLQSSVRFSVWANRYPMLYILLVGGLSAGLFEETARLIGGKLLRRLPDGLDVVNYGLGHGLCEMLVLVGFGHLNNMMACWVIANPEQAASVGVDAATLQLMTQQMNAVTPGLIAWGLLERVSALGFHLAATGLVFWGLRKGSALFYLAAVAAHTLFNTVAAILAQTNIALCELVLLAASCCMLWQLMRHRNSFEGSTEFAQKSTFHKV